MIEYKVGQLYAIQFVKQDKVAICSYDPDLHLFIDNKGEKLSVEFIENMIGEKEAAIKELIDQEQLMDIENHKVFIIKNLINKDK